MEDEKLELDLDTTEEINREKDRNKKLADKVKDTSKERDDAIEKATKADQERASALRDAEFYKNFNSVSQKYQGSNEYQEKIREKVNLGLDVEEATMLIMAKEGKYTSPVAQVEKESAAGGSAATAMQADGGKSPQEMSQAERKSALEIAFAKGELSL